MARRKQSYPPAKTATRQTRGAGLAGDPTYVRPTVAKIDPAALEVRTDISVGDRVTIAGGGLYSGEQATVEAISHGSIPAMVVRTDEGKTRRVRGVDLQLVVGDRKSAD